MLVTALVTAAPIAAPTIPHLGIKNRVQRHHPARHHRLDPDQTALVSRHKQQIADRADATVYQLAQRADDQHRPAHFKVMDRKYASARAQK